MTGLMDHTSILGAADTEDSLVAYKLTTPRIVAI